MPVINGLGGMINYFLKEEIDYKKGKLNKFPSYYIFSDKGCTNRNGVYLGPYETEDGRKISLTLKKGINNCPKPPIENCVPNFRQKKKSITGFLTTLV